MLSPVGVTAHSDDNLKRVVDCIVLLETQKVAFEKRGFQDDTQWEREVEKQPWILNMIQEYFTLVTQTHCDIMWIIVFKDLFFVLVLLLCLNSPTSFEKQTKNFEKVKDEIILWPTNYSERVQTTTQRSWFPKWVVFGQLSGKLCFRCILDCLEQSWCSNSVYVILVVYQKDQMWAFCYVHSKL